MFRTVQPIVWAFDCEWVPDAAAGRRLLGLPHDLPEADVFDAMWRAAGATSEQPRPYLKTVLCRIVSIAVLERRTFADGSVRLHLCSLPKRPEDRESDLLLSFFGGLAKRRPQLVGYNSRSADLTALVQRGVALGLTAPGLCERPERPWEGPDYFHPYSEWHIDLMRLFGGRGATCPSLKELALAAGIPAKLHGNSHATSGADVADLWLRGEHEVIRRYNEIDALTTYLLWLRTAHFAGCFSPQAYVEEEGRVEALLERFAEAGDEHFAAFLERWRCLPSPA